MRNLEKAFSQPEEKNTRPNFLFHVYVLFLNLLSVNSVPRLLQSINEAMAERPDCGIS